MKVWLDDRRSPHPDPETWVWVTTPAEAIALLETGEVTELSLDHDLGLLDGEREVTGYEVVLWIEEAVATRASWRRPRSVSTRRTRRAPRGWSAGSRRYGGSRQGRRSSDALRPAAR